MQLQAIAQDSNLQTNKSINNVLFEITKIYPCTGLIVLATNKDKPAEGAAPASPEPKHPMMEHKHPLSVKCHINQSKVGDRNCQGTIPKPLWFRPYQYQLIVFPKIGYFIEK